MCLQGRGGAAAGAADGSDGLTVTEQQVAKLMEQLAGSTREVSALKEEAQKAEILLKEVKSQLSSKSQGLETANGTIEDLKARVSSLEGSMESIKGREQVLSKDLENARHLQKDAEDRLANHS